MKVAVTGGRGFIGAHLVQLHLDRGDTVRVLRRDQDRGARPPAGVSWHVADLMNARPGDLRRFVEGIDVLYHCAGEVRDEGRMRAVHVEGTRRLLDAATGRAGRWVQLSSVGVYGRRMEGEVTEDTPWNPVGEYERTKGVSDELVLDAAARGRIEAVVLRPSIVFAADMRSTFLKQLARAIASGRFFFVGEPGASANFVHVGDVAAALLLCGAHPEAGGRVYNLSGWCPLESAVESIAAALRRPPPRLRLPEAPVRAASRLLSVIPGFPLTPRRIDALTNRSWYPIIRLERELGFRLTTALEAGLAACVREWFA